MKTLPAAEATKLWDQWWNETKHEWFKIETLQDYSGEDNSPSLEAWLAGDREKSISLMPEYGKNWIQLCQKSPAQKRRLHIVQEPYSPYLEWEIELYKQINIPLAGEEVHLIPNKDIAHLNIPAGDVMIFDTTRVIKNHYSKQGRLEAMTFYDQPQNDDIESFLSLKADLLKYAFPLK